MYKVRLIIVFVLAISAQLNLAANEKSLNYEQLLEELVQNVNGKQTSDWLIQQLNRIKAPAKRILFVSKSSQSNDPHAFPVGSDSTSEFDVYAPDWFQLYLRDPTSDYNFGLLNRYFEFDFKLDNPFGQSESVQVNGLSNVQQDYLATAHQAGSQVVPVLKLLNCSYTELTTLLTDQMLQQIVAKQLLKLAQKHELKGFILDIWRFFPKNTRTELVKLIKVISQNLRANKLQAFLMVPVDSAKADNQAFLKENLEQLAQYLNGFILNTLHFPTKKAGPVQPIDWIKQTIKALIPKHHSPVRSKVTILINLETRIFDSDGAKSINQRKLVSILSKHKPMIKFNENSNEYYFDAIIKSERKRIFVPVRETIERRIKLIAKMNCGIAFTNSAKNLAYLQRNNPFNQTDYN